MAAKRVVEDELEYPPESKKVLLVAQIDDYANGVRPRVLERFLREHDHHVELVDTYYLGRASANTTSLLNKLPAPSLAKLGVYLVELASLLLRRSGLGRKNLSYYLLLADYHLRQRALRGDLDLDEFDLVVCEHPQDSGLLRSETSACTLYDCPTPYADELHDEGRLTEGQHRKFRRLERDLFEQVDYLSFHWESYARYAVEQYGISGRNVLQLNWGCNPTEERARFESPPRVIYLGSLSSRYIDLPLLSRLTELYPHIDVYGGPPPDPALGLNFRGWAQPAILSEYQFGLITCTKDDLRRDGFSAKHLNYIACGLPVLVPAWRRHLELLRGSLPYEEDTFCSIIEAHTDESVWALASNEAYDQAKKLTWEQTLSPLAALLRELPGRPSADPAE